VLDQLLADEWRHVGMVEQTVECLGACGRADVPAGMLMPRKWSRRFMLPGVDRIGSCIRSGVVLSILAKV